MATLRLCLPVLVLSGWAPAQEFGVLVEHFEIRETDATHLLLSSEEPAALRAAMDRLGAEAFDVAYLLARHGERSRARSVIEYLYPTEWDPAEVIAEIAADVSADMDLKLPAQPTAFEARNLGNTLSVSDIDRQEDPSQASLVTEVSRLLAEHAIGDRSLGIVQPEFGVRELSSDPGFTDGQPILLGMFTPREADRRDRRIFAFATPMSRDPAARAETGGAGEKLADPFSDPEGTVRGEDFGVTVGVEFIEVVQSQLAELLTGVPRVPGAPSEVREKAEQMIAAGEASLLASGTLKTTLGQRAKIQPVHEFIYPTEYDPAELVPKLTPEILAGGTSLKAPAVPAAFDVRYLGMTFEAEPAIVGVGDQEVIEVAIAVELVDLARRAHWGKAEAEVEQPIFRVLSCETGLRVKPGDEALAAILTPRKIEDGDPDGQRRILVIVWTELARVGDQ